MAEASVSVVTPSYNQGEFIERTVRSVLEQGIDGLDYFVVDGGSSDGTVEVLRRYQDRLRWVSEPDRGQADAVNKGLRGTRGEIIGWINSDDVYYPGALAAVRHVFAEHPEVDVVYGRADHIDVDDAVLEPYPTEPWDAEDLAEVCFLCQPATFFRRRVVELYGPLDARLRYCMDYEYWLRLSRGLRLDEGRLRRTRAEVGEARFAYLDEALAGSRLYGTNKTLGERVAVHREINDMMLRTLGAVPDRWLSNYAHAALEGSRAGRSPLAFAIAVSVRSWLAALRWNRRISPELRRTTWGWIRGNAEAWWQRWRGR